MGIPEAWREFKVRNTIAIYGFVIGLPLITLIAIALKKWDENIAGTVFVVLMLIWVILWGWSAFRLVRWPCPRCGKAWLANQEPYLLAKRTCSSCGLHIYEQP